MSDTRHASTAIIAGTVAVLVTMGLHPTGSEVIRNAAAGGYNVIARGTHLLAILALPPLLTGFAHFTQVLSARRTAAQLGYGAFALGIVSVMIAAACSGLVAPALADLMAGGDAAAQETLRTLLRYTAVLNRTFATIYVTLAGVALLAWGAALLREPARATGLAILGVVLGGSGLLAGATGTVPLGVRGFGVVVLLQSSWMVWAAIWLRRQP